MTGTLRTAGALGGVLAGVVLLALGVAAARADVAVLGVPLLVAGLWETVPRHDRTRVTIENADAEADAHAGRTGYRVRVDADPAAEAVQLRVVLGSGRVRDLVVAASTHEVTGSAPAWHSGPLVVATVTHRAFGRDAAWVGRPGTPAVLRRVVLPRRVDLGGDQPLPPRLKGITGIHDSTRLGDGGEFFDVNPFQPGDRLRRVDWRATARLRRGPADLFVRRTTARSDASVVIAVDTRDDITGLVSSWTTPASLVERTSSLDLAREAAVSLAADYTHAGDRVAFHDLADQGRVVRPGGGRRHLDRVVRAASGIDATGTWTRRLRAPVVTAGALVYLVGTHLDDVTERLATAWWMQGHRVVLVDVLPPTDTAGLDDPSAIALHLVLVDREERLLRLRGLGIDVLDWRRSGPDAQRTASLRTIARAGRRHR